MSLWSGRPLTFSVNDSARISIPVNFFMPRELLRSKAYDDAVALLLQLPYVDLRHFHDPVCKLFSSQ